MEKITCSTDYIVLRQIFGRQMFNDESYKRHDSGWLDSEAG